MQHSNADIPNVARDLRDHGATRRANPRLRDGGYRRERRRALLSSLTRSLGRINTHVRWERLRAHCQTHGERAARFQFASRLKQVPRGVATMRAHTDETCAHLETSSRARSSRGSGLFHYSSTSCRRTLFPASFGGGEKNIYIYIFHAPGAENKKTYRLGPSLLATMWSHIYTFPVCFSLFPTRHGEHGSVNQCPWPARKLRFYRDLFLFREELETVTYWKYGGLGDGIGAMFKQSGPSLFAGFSPVCIFPSFFLFRRLKVGKREFELIFVLRAPAFKL